MQYLISECVGILYIRGKKKQEINATRTNIRSCIKGEGKKKYIYMQYSIFGNSMIRNGSNLVESSFI